MEKVSRLEEYNYSKLDSRLSSNLHKLPMNGSRLGSIAIILATGICSFLIILAFFRIRLCCLLDVNGENHRLSKRIAPLCSAYTTRIISENGSK